MSKSLNSAQIIGALGQDPEIKYTGNGTAIANISVATNSGWQDKKTGDWQDRVDWHRCVLFGKLAEIAEKYLKRGSKIYLQGRIQTRSYEKDGITRYSTEIVGNELIMLDSKGNAEQPKDYQKPENENSSGPADDSWTESIPF